MVLTSFVSNYLHHCFTAWSTYCIACSFIPTYLDAHILQWFSNDHGCCQEVFIILHENICLLRLSSYIARFSFLSIIHVFFTWYMSTSSTIILRSKMLFIMLAFIKNSNVHYLLRRINIFLNTSWTTGYRFMSPMHACIRICRSVDSAEMKWVPGGDNLVKDVQCYELFGGIALIYHAFSFFADLFWVNSPVKKWLILRDVNLWIDCMYFRSKIKFHLQFTDILSYPIACIIYSSFIKDAHKYLPRYK